MRLAYFDAISGAAGDMVLGALIDAGLEIDRLRAELAKIAIGDYTVTAERVEKHHIGATQFLVHDPADQRPHHHHQPAHGRSLRQILDLVRESSLDLSVKERATAIIRRIGEAEARIHGVDVDEVHFHEVGEIDSIVDMVGAAIALALMHIDDVYCSALPLGDGIIETRHGMYPIPAPATLEILARAGVPTRPGVSGTEQVTPTGAAILTTVSTFRQPAMRVQSVGYGAGQADLAIPNVLRVWIGEPVESISEEQISVLETNIDDMQPELLAHVLDRCLEEGALDALLICATMKKGRPATKLEVLAEPGQVQRLVQLLLRETSTFGVRVGTRDRYPAERRSAEVQTAYGPVPVKLKLIDGRPVGVAPEYEVCRRLASERSIPLIEVYGAAMAAGRSLLDERS